MEDTDDNDDVPFEGVEQEMPWPSNRVSDRPISAESQVPTSDIAAKLRPCCAACSQGLSSDVIDSGAEQNSVAQLRIETEMVLRPRQDSNDVRLSGSGEPIARHQPAFADSAATRASIAAHNAAASSLSRTSM